MKKALITGITGQDGSFLSELLLDKGYKVYGLIRRSSNFNTQRIDHIFDKITLLYSDITDPLSIIDVIKKTQPDEIYNLAAMSHVQVSFSIPYYTIFANALGLLNILESVRILNLKTKIYQASSSELYGKVLETPQNEKTPFYPRSPYGISKLTSYWIAVNYREAYNMFVANGILFNHESERRGNTFVTKKIVSGIINILLNKQSCLYIGNLYAVRDWGYAKDYVYAMYLMMQQSIAKDYVISTGIETSVKEFIIKTFKYLGISIEFKGKDLNEIAIIKDINRGLLNKNHNINTNIKEDDIVIRVDSKYYRKTEVDLLVGDNTKAKKELGWETKYNIDDIIKIMVDNEISENDNNIKKSVNNY